MSFQAFLVGVGLLGDANPGRSERCASLLFDVLAEEPAPAKAQGQGQPCVSTSRVVALLHAASKQREQHQQHQLQQQGHEQPGRGIENGSPVSSDGPLAAGPDAAMSMAREDFVAWALGGAAAEGRALGQAGCGGGGGGGGGGGTLAQAPVVALAAAAAYTPPPPSNEDVLAVRHPDAVDIGMPKGSVPWRRGEPSPRVAPAGH